MTATTASTTSTPGWITRLVGWAGLAVGQLILLLARVLTGVRGIWRGTTAAPEPRVYFANHASHGDFVLIWATLPAPLRRRTRPVAGQDYWLASALRRFIGSQVFKALLINRQTEPGGSTTVDLMAAALARGDSLIFFPEGTRNTGDAALLPFKSGLYHLARRCPQLELVPVWVDNIRRVIPKGQWLPVPMICSVSYGAPLQVAEGESKAEFLQRAEAAVLALRPTESIEA